MVFAERRKSLFETFKDDSRYHTKKVPWMLRRSVFKYFKLDVQNQQDALHWIATVNFLRTVTKMFFGQDDDTGLKGNPPPILHLSGYGDHMFQKVPVVLNSFNVELRSGIDYISTKQSDSFYANRPDVLDSSNQTWAPTLSNISVLVTPIYSRESIKNFSMKDFVRGKLNGKGTNEIGFI